MATPNAPDALGGIGYANIFEGSPAIDDWREDLRYGSAVKAKKAADDAARQAALKLPKVELDGWHSRDMYELNAGYDVLMKTAADKIANGEDPMKDYKFVTDMNKLLQLGKASQEQETAFNTGMADLQNMYDKGDISPETYAQKRQEWIDYANAGVPDNQVGRMYSRLQLEPPESPATMPDMIAFIQKNQGVLEKKKEMKSFPTASGMQHTTKGVPQSVVDEQITVMEQDPLWGRFSPDQQEQIKKAIVVGSEVSDKPLSKGGALEFNFGAGSGGNKNYQVAYSQYVPKGTKESGLSMAEMQPTDAFEFVGEVPKRNISNIQVITVVDEEGNQEQKTVQNIDDFIPLRIYKQDGKFIAEGTGIYENEEGVKKQSDMSFVIEGKTNRNLIERNYFGGNDLDEAMKKMKGGVSKQAGSKKKISGF